MLTFPLLNPRRSHGRTRKSPTAGPASAPPAVALGAVHVQQDSNTLQFVFDAPIASIEGVVAEQFQCTLGGEPVAGNSIEGFDAAGIVINFGQDVSPATAGTLLSGEGIVFDNGGHAADGQSVAVTPP